MTDLRTDYDSTDLIVTNGDLVLASDDQQNLQAVVDILRTGLQEYPFDTSYGTPYLQTIIEKQQVQAIVDTIIRDRAASVLDEGYSIQNYTSSLDTTTRHLTVSFDLYTPDGTSVPFTTSIGA